MARGWYDDVLARTPNGWRISRRTTRMLAASGDALGGDGIDAKADTYSLRQETDAAGSRSFCSPQTLHAIQLKGAALRQPTRQEPGNSRRTKRTL